MYWFAFPALRSETEAICESCRSVADVLDEKEREQLASGVDALRSEHATLACFVYRRSSGTVEPLSKMQASDYGADESEVRRFVVWLF